VPEVPAHGVRLYVEERGSGEPILLIHGTASWGGVWQPSTVGALSELGRLVVYDRRGCGRSERPEPYETNVAQHAEDAAALLEVLDAIPAVVIGRSYGGETAVELTLRYPDRVRALVLLEAAALGLDGEARAFNDVLHREVEAAAERDPSSVAEVFLRRVLGDRAWESFKPEVRDVFVANGPAIVAEFRGGYLQATEGDLATIGVPTLLVAGEASPPAFRRVTDRMAAAIPDARTVIVGGGHFIDPGLPEVLAFVRDQLRTA
jgi:pimeloyl-ACP methyl ester carboxylesterase